MSAQFFIQLRGAVSVAPRTAHGAIAGRTGAMAGRTVIDLEAAEACRICVPYRTSYIYPTHSTQVSSQDTDAMSISEDEAQGLVRHVLRGSGISFEPASVHSGHTDTECRAGSMEGFLSVQPCVIHPRDNISAARDRSKVATFL